LWKCEAGIIGVRSWTEGTKILHRATGGCVGKGKAAVGNGAVAIVTDKVGEFQASFTGEFRDGKLTFDSRGTNRGGETVEGKGFMEREPR
jgi:hypothetical protein